MKISKMFFLSCFIICALFSCKKSSSVNVNDLDKIKKSDAELLKLSNFASTSVNGKISFEVKGTFLSQFENLNLSFLGRFHTSASMNEPSTSINGVLMKINNDVITPNSVLDYRKDYILPNSIIGVNNNISLRIDNTTPLLSHQFRMPKLIEFQNFTLPQNGISQLKQNDVVGIKADSENKKGLMVVLTYDPYFLNDSLFSAGFRNEIRNLQIQDDDGVIELDADLFAGIPKRCHYKLEIGRFNYEIVSNSDGKKYAFYNLNALGGYCKNF